MRLGPDLPLHTRTDLDAATNTLLDRLASGPTVALGLAKQAINRSDATSLTDA